MSVPQKNVIIFATADWKTPYWTNKQHQAKLFQSRGYEVIYVESFGLRMPGLNGKDLRRIFARLFRSLRPIQKVDERIWVYSPLMVPVAKSNSFTNFINKWMILIPLKLHLIFRGLKNSIVWTYHPFIQNLLPHLQFSKLVYHCVDDLAAVPGIDPIKLRDNEKSLVKFANSIFVTSKKLYDLVREWAPNKTYYYPNVADIEHFSRARNMTPWPQDMANIKSPIIGYIGALSDFKVDFELIYRVAINRPDWHWVIIGDEREGQKSETLSRLAKLSNVHLLGKKPYSQLPEYLHTFTVATLPTLINPYTESMFPMKFFEYLAAGKTVLSTNLPSLKEFDHLFYKAHDAKEFEDKLALIIENNQKLVAPLNTINQFNWDTRMDEMLNITLA